MYVFVNVLCYSNRILFIVVSIKNIVDMNVTNSSFSKNTTVEQNLSSVSGLIAFDLTQCISGNGEVVMKVLEVDKLRTIKILRHYPLL